MKSSVHPAIWRQLFVLAVAAIPTSVGCVRRMDKWEARRPKTYNVQGRVLVDGKPEAGVVVSFESKVHNLTAVGISDGDGLFLLKTFREGDGAVAGDHAVALSKQVMVAPAGAGPETPMSQIMFLPKKYASSATSGLTATVLEERLNKITFEVSK